MLSLFPLVRVTDSDCSLRAQFRETGDSSRNFSVKEDKHLAWFVESQRIKKKAHPKRRGKKTKQIIQSIVVKCILNIYYNKCNIIIIGFYISFSSRLVLADI